MFFLPWKKAVLRPILWSFVSLGSVLTLTQFGQGISVSAVGAASFPGFLRNVTASLNATTTIQVPGVAPQFVDYYTSHDGLRVLGHPISGLQTLNGFPVQYFEKGRIEDQSAVTSDPVFKIQFGLLADDLQNAQAAIPVGGDTSTITYANLHRLAEPAQRLTPPTGFTGGTAQLDNGSIFVPYSATLAPANGHTVPPYFWKYINRSDLFTAGWIHDIGLPMAEPAQATVTKFGLTRTITIQIFQRTVLTYDPANPDTYQVERANVGTDYLKSFPPGPTQPLPGRLAYDTSERQVFVINPDGSGLIKVTNGWSPLFSPDGKRIAYLNALNPHPPFGTVAISTSTLTGSDQQNLCTTAGNAQLNLVR